MNVREDHMLLPDGTEIEEFHVIEYPDWVCILCFTPEGEAVLVEQYRHGIGRSSLELPSGGIDEAESPLAAAKRELLEETGYEAKAWTDLGRIAPEPSKHTNWAHFFVAHDAVRIAEPDPGPGELLSVKLLVASELRDAMRSGGVVHGIHVAAYFRAESEGLVPGVTR